jgi:hypothetical protein
VRRGEHPGHLAQRPAGIEPRLGQHCAQMFRYERPMRELPGRSSSSGTRARSSTARPSRIQKRHGNAWLEISGLSLGQLREVLDEADPDRVVFGSDWPFYHPVLPLAKVLIATEGRPELRRKVLHDNAARLLDGARRHA